MTTTKKKLKELEEWIDNISEIQNQLLEELGYEIRWINPSDSKVYISKIKKVKDK